MSDSDESDVRRLMDERDIRALSATYARGLDRHSGELVRSVFSDDATTHYGTFTGGPDEMATMAMRSLASHDSTQHILGQINLWFVGADEAHGEVYFQAYHRAPLDDVPMDRFICGRYIDRYRRVDGSWLMSHRTEVVDWTRTEPAADDYFTKRPQTVRGDRDESDLSYRPQEA